MNKMFYTWKDFEEDISYFKAVIESNNITHLVTLYRGGLPLGVKLSNVCSLPLSILDYQSYDGKSDKVTIIKDKGLRQKNNVLLIDDICDSGNSITKSLDFLTGINVKVCTIYSNNNKHNKDWLYCREHNNEWVVFPWE